MSLTTVIVGFFGMSKIHEMNEVGNSIFYNNSNVLYPLSDASAFLNLIERLSNKAIQGDRNAVAEIGGEIANVSGQIGNLTLALEPDKAEMVQTQLDKYLTSLRDLYNEISRDTTVSAATLNRFRKESLDFDRLLYELNKQSRVSGLQSYNKGKEIYASARNIQILISITGVFLSVLIGIAVSFSIIRPLQQLRNTTNLLAQGDLNARVTIKTNDEVGAVGKAFNQAIDELRIMVTETTDSAKNMTKASNSLFEATNETSRSLSELNHLVTDLANGASIQANTVDSTINVFREVTEDVGQVAQASKKLIEVDCKNASLSAQQGEKAAAVMTGVIDNLVQTVGMISKMVLELAEDSQKIKQFTGVINEIAERTNLLSLNASIEAARAGEHGRGFAVVANNIRQLANQAQESVKIIDNIVEEIDEKTQQAVNTMEKGTKEVDNNRTTLIATINSFKELVIQVDNIVKQISLVTETTQQMTSKNQDAIEAMAKISQISEDNLAAVEEVSATFEEQYASTMVITEAARQLQAMAEQMTIVSNKFKL